MCIPSMFHVIELSSTVGLLFCDGGLQFCSLWLCGWFPAFFFQYQTASPPSTPPNDAGVPKLLPTTGLIAATFSAVIPMQLVWQRLIVGHTYFAFESYSKAWRAIRSKERSKEKALAPKGNKTTLISNHRNATPSRLSAVTTKRKALKLYPEGDE